jgi:quinol monooxygenase YgiN
MNSIQKKIMPLLMAFLAAAVFSCNNSDEKKEEPAKTDTLATAATVTPAPAAFTPFDIMEINHTVKDFAKWKPAFDADSTARKASGLENLALGKELDNPSSLNVALKMADVQKAKAFAADPRLKQVMDKNGVTSKPDIGYYHVLRFNPDSKEKQWVLITHKVKDFDAWLKVYDEEGPATRAANGLVDVALARSIDDPNTVHIVFDIKDMAKAKARISSPELKKLMTDAGVTGAPTIKFYSQAE